MFVQKGLSLFASSGEYRANISLLRHLANLGHDTAQICFAQEGEVETCVKQAGGVKANLTNTKLSLSASNGTIVEISVSMFTHVYGIHTIALDGASFRKVFPRKLFTKKTKEFIEVSREP